MKWKWWIAFAIGVVCACCGSSARAQSTKALLLFGGEDHKVFLGCLNCAATDRDSVCNQFGAGSQFRTDGIWNQFGHFGSQFSTDSPWNKFSNSAPIIVDNDGGSYGSFSANKFHRERTRIARLVRVLNFQADHEDIEATRDLMCGGND